MLPRVQNFSLVDFLLIHGTGDGKSGSLARKTTSTTAEVILARTVCSVL